MTSTASPARPLHARRGLPAAAALEFPSRSVASVRRLRDSLFRQGHHELALRAAREVAHRDPGRESFFHLGFLLREVGRPKEALRAFRDALRFREGAAYLVPEIHLHIAYSWFLLGKRKRMGEALRRAYAQRPKPRTAFSFHMALGADCFARKKWREAVDEYARAEVCASQALKRGRAACNRGAALLRMAALDEARGHLDRAVAILRRARHKAELAIARSVRAALYFEQGQFRRAMGMWIHAARGFRMMGKPDREAENLFNASYAAVELGLWAKAKILLDRAVSLASSIGKRSVLGCAYAARAVACAYLEEFKEAEENLSRAVSFLRGRRDWIASLHVLRARARIARLFGNWEEVRRHARSAERLAAKEGDVPRVVEFRKLRAQAEKNLGRKRAAHFAGKGAERLEGVLDSAPGTREVARLAAKVARSELPVLIVGESGTGGEEMARAIHQASPRAKGPCVLVPCEQLVFPASDLEGHVAGAWSGARQGSEGMVRRASGGTLVLDQVDLLAPEDQRALLRVVERRVRPVGGAAEHAVDVRVVATCREIGKLIPDLRKRLAGAVLRLPPLRERKGDVPHLVRQWLDGRRAITADALAELAQRPWEGNLPELRSAVERLVALTGETIGRRHVLQALAPVRRPVRPMPRRPAPVPVLI